MLRSHLPLCLLLALLSAVPAAPLWAADRPAAEGPAANSPAVNSPAAAAELQRSAAREQELSQSVAEGRAALAKGDLGAARRAFEQAAQLDRGGSESTFWLQRLEIAEGSHESVLSKLSRQRREGKAGPDEAYLQALALEALANEQLRNGGGGVGLMLEDAFNALEPVSAAGGERYRDVHLPLARTARQLGRHSASEAAARRALEVDANSSEAAGLLGRALLGQLAALPNDEGNAEERKRLYTAAVAAFEGALKSLGERPEGQAGLSAAAEIWNQLGTAHAFGQDTAAAGKAYAQAIGFDPAMLDLGAIYNTLGAAEFARTCEAGSAEFVKRAGAKDARDATTSGGSDLRSSASTSLTSARRRARPFRPPWRSTRPTSIPCITWRAWTTTTSSIPEPLVTSRTIGSAPPKAWC